MSSAYANTVNCCLPIFIPLENIFILCITFYNGKLNNIGDKESIVHTVNFNDIQFFTHLIAFLKILSTNVMWESMNIFYIFSQCCYHDAYLCFKIFLFNNV